MRPYVSDRVGSGQVGSGWGGSGTSSSHSASCVLAARAARRPHGIRSTPSRSARVRGRHRCSQSRCDVGAASTWKRLSERKTVRQQRRTGFGTWSRTTSSGLSRSVNVAVHVYIFIYMYICINAYMAQAARCSKLAASAAPALKATTAGSRLLVGRAGSPCPGAAEDIERVAVAHLFAVSWFSRAVGLPPCSGPPGPVQQACAAPRQARRRRHRRRGAVRRRRNGSVPGQGWRKMPR